LEGPPIASGELAGRGTISEAAEDPDTTEDERGTDPA